MEHRHTREFVLSDEFKVLGSNLLVERYRPPDKWKRGGLIILPRDYMQFDGVGMTSLHDNPRLKVLKVGPGEILDNGERENMHGLKPGDIIVADSLVTDPQRNILVSEEVDKDSEGIFMAHIINFECKIEEDDA